MINPKAVIFDLYGTLVDVEIDESSSSFWEALANDLLRLNCVSTGEQLKELYRILINEEAQHKPEGFLLEGVFTKILTNYGIPPSPANIGVVGECFRKRSLVVLRKKPYTDRILSSLRGEHYLVALLSNTEHLLTNYDLKQMELTDSFHIIVQSSAFGEKKPHPRIFQEILRRLEISGQEAVFVGDSFNEDIVGAVNAGIDAIFLTQSDPGTKAQIEAEYGQHVLCADFTEADIVSALQRMNFHVASPVTP